MYNKNIVDRDTKKSPREKKYKKERKDDSGREVKTKKKYKKRKTIYDVEGEEEDEKKIYRPVQFPKFNYSAPASKNTYKIVKDMVALIDTKEYEMPPDTNLDVLKIYKFAKKRREDGVWNRKQLDKYLTKNLRKYVPKKTAVATEIEMYNDCNENMVVMNENMIYTAEKQPDVTYVQKPSAFGERITYSVAATIRIEGEEPKVSKMRNTVSRNVDFRQLLALVYNEEKDFFAGSGGVYLDYHRGRGRKRLTIHSTEGIIFSTKLSPRNGPMPTLEQILFNCKASERYLPLDVDDISIELYNSPKENEEVSGGATVCNVLSEEYKCKTLHVYFPSDKYCGQLCLYASSLKKGALRTFLGKSSVDQIKVLRKKGVLNKYPNEQMKPNDFKEDICIYHYTGSTMENPKGGHYYTDDNKKKPVFLLLKNHYYILKKPKSIFAAMKYSECKGGCGKIVNKFHKCANVICDCGVNCKTIAQYTKHTKKNITEICNICKVDLIYKGCKESHKCLKGKIQCRGCNKHIKIGRLEEHNENDCTSEIKCGNCGEFDNIALHKCYLKPKKEKKSCDYYAYDIECFAKGIDKNNKTLVKQEFAMMCIGKIEETKDDSKIDTFVCIEDLIEWIITRTERTVLFAHNGGKYDNIIIREALLRSGAIKISGIPLHSGNKIIQFGVRGVDGKSAEVIFRDSVAHLSMKLSDLPRAFGLDNISKTMFPYDFFTRENKDFEGVVPIKYYNLNHTDEKVLARQLDEIEDLGDFKLFELCKTYCKNDVKILIQSMYSYQQTMLDICEIDPLNYITKASYVMAVYLLKFMPKKSVSYLQPHVGEFVRRGFYGGRTNCIRKYYKGKFKSMDISSEYPTVQKYDALPGRLIKYVMSDRGKHTLGDVEFMPGMCNKFIEDNYNRGVVGFFECDITPPTDLLHPVLPIRDGKLIFSLEPIKKKVYYSNELLLAIQKGYKITKIYTQALFTATNNLFKDFVDKFYKLKCEINKDENPAYYSSVKIILNSLWGKFGEVTHLNRLEIINDKDVAKYINLLKREASGTIRYKGSTIIPCYGGETMFYSYEKERLKYQQTKGSIAVAAAVTACGRVRLYEGINYYNEDILYFDTDSIYFIDSGKPKFVSVMPIDNETGLGIWDDEITNGTEFVSLGPKMYAYITEQYEGVRTKGVARNKLNFKIMKDLVDGEADDVHIVKDIRFIASKLGVSIDKQFEKKIRVTCSKREYMKNNDEYFSLPFGYKL